MAMSISPPSGRSASLHLCKDRNCLVFVQGAFPFLRALCANVPVCGGSFWAVGVSNARMKELSGSVEDGRSATAATARQMSLSLTLQEGNISVYGRLESAHSCRSVYPGFGSMYFRFYTAL